MAAILNRGCSPKQNPGKVDERVVPRTLFLNSSLAGQDDKLFACVGSLRRQEQTTGHQSSHL